MEFRMRRQYHQLLFAILLLITTTRTIRAEKLSTGSICLNEIEKSVDKIKCSSSNQAILITLVQYSGDSCATTHNNQNNHQPNTTGCVAYPTQSLADFCNGKTECLVRLERAEFRFGQMGSNCNFRAEQMLINYECIPIKFDDPTVPKYDICAQNKLLNPLYGFIHSPNYPSSYPATVYCQMTLHLDESTMQRVELFLIDLETEALSLKTYEPTDYLEIDNKEKLFGKKRMQLVRNSTGDVLLKFRTDLLFSKRGFFLYFQTVTKRAPKAEIDFEEDTVEYVDIKTTTLPPTTTTSTTTTTTTTETISNATNDYESSRVVIEAGGSKTTTEMNNKTVVFLTCLIIILTLAILFLIFVNRNRIIKYQGGKRGSNSSDHSLFISQPIDPRINDTSVFNGHNHLDTSINLMPGGVGGGGGPLLVPVKLDQNKRISIDMDSSSMTHLLLLNATRSSFIDSPVVIYDVKKQPPRSVVATINGAGEVYDDISLQDMDTMMSKKATTHQTETTTNNMVKPNEYCYIHVNGSIIGHLDNIKPSSQVNPANNIMLNSEDVLDTCRSSSSCVVTTSSNSSSIHSSPSHGCNSSSSESSSRRIQVTSTPSLPKTLPPVFKKFEDDATATTTTTNDASQVEEDQPNGDTVYQTCSDTIVGSTSDQTSEIKQQEESTLVVFTSAKSNTNRTEVKSRLFDYDDNDDEYQVPTNIPNRF